MLQKPITVINKANQDKFTVIAPNQKKVRKTSLSVSYCFPYLSGNFDVSSSSVEPT